MKVVSFSSGSGENCYGRIDGSRFFIGKRVTYDGRTCLESVRGAANQRYTADPYRADFGYWAEFLFPTSVCERGLFHTLNTYARVRFTSTAF